jgi:hypothetical protein
MGFNLAFKVLSNTYFVCVVNVQIFFHSTIQMQLFTILSPCPSVAEELFVICPVQFGSRLYSDLPFGTKDENRIS